jgi:hypothetical protein
MQFPRITAMPDAAHQWEIVPRGLFSWHYDMRCHGELIASLQMTFWTEGCNFTIADHPFAIRRVSLGREWFLLLSGDQSVGEAKRKFGLRRFELTAAGESWLLQPASWFSRIYRLLAANQEVGAIRPAGWLTRRRLADFAADVPPPIQVLAIFLVLVISRRQNRHPVGS